MQNVAVIGYGYWGPNLVRNFMNASTTNVLYVCDQSEDQLSRVKNLYPTIKLTTSLDEVLADSEVDAVSIATPVNTHYELAMKALEAGKHVLVEKPMADSSEKCKRMIEEAEKRNLTLMVDHTFPYTGAVKKIGELSKSGELGELYYFDSVRVNLGLFQSDVSVLWDLAVHDLSILESFTDNKPIAVSATGIAHVQGKPVNTAYLTVFYEGSFIAHIHANWLAPVKLRQTLIGGSEKMVVYDDLEPTEKIKIYDKGITVDPSAANITEMRVGYRAGDMWAPKLENIEALNSLVTHFVDVIENGTDPITSAESGARIVRILEAATESIEKNGQRIQL